MKNKQEEIFIVVDKNDKVLGYKPRSVCHKERLLHRTAAVAVMNNKSEVLLQKRSRNVEMNPGKYTLSASGHVSKGETYEEAAQKELKEELGITGKLKFEKKIIKDFPDHFEMQSFYTTDYNGPFKIQKDEVEKVEFVPVDKLPEYFSKSLATISIFYNQILKKDTKATAIGPTNIAFTKYWGKKDEVFRLPENGSISMTLSHLLTTTTVEFLPKYKKDQISINGLFTSEVSSSSNPAYTSEVSAERVIKHLDRVRKMAGIQDKAKVVSKNNFPIGTGLSSSASGFAALTLAASKAAGLKLSEKELSILARQGAGSACRSIPGGFVEWLDGDTSDTSYAVQIFPPNHWAICDVVAIVSEGRKEISSSTGMKAAISSPFMKLRLSRMKEKNKLVKKYIKERDFKALGELTEQEALELHTIMLTQYPPLIYWTPGTLQIMKLTSHWRGEGIPVYFTINTGQDIHLICEQANLKKVVAKLKELDFVKNIIVNTPGEGTRLSKSHLF
ncbi:diphosphomevalonate decarboxylase [Candidatus Microgenomates bacterium]|nr:diphosphomevalonate decarboxylase [Candidatus Microgenomates bacterium]